MTISDIICSHRFETLRDVDDIIVSMSTMIGVWCHFVHSGAAKKGRDAS